MKAIKIETKRLYLVEMSQEDRLDLCEILQDEQTMYAYEHAFSDEEVDQWLDRQLQRYREDGFGLWAIKRKEDHVMVGQCGLTWQMVDGERLLEIGYLLKRKYWHQGYAIEAAKACKEYAFQVLGSDDVCSIIRDSNIASRKVALRNKMKKKKQIIKHYQGMDMPHDIFMVEKEEK
ncbi:GNAT family N-acetyltransferase [[Eubacterium] hominis]|uniref:GNAT family N-acetyltransferase n=1 Tax=[Eubacterium] hominis TaxID=2764325 RepID=UPI003A4D3DC0